MPGDRVGLCMDRDLGLPISLLGILKAGASYVPLDPSYPEERIRFMAQDAGTRMIVHSADYGGLFIEGSKLEFPACPDADSLFTFLNDQSLPAPEIAPDSADVYTIYTSGSTGLPKGVVMPQRALNTLLAWQINEAGLGEPLRTLQFTPISFDVHFQEFFGTWLVGGELVLVDDRVRRDAVQLFHFIVDGQIQRLFLPFVALQQLCEVATGLGTPPHCLQHVVTAGEQLRITPAIRRFFSQSPNCRLHNHYGPSETHVVTAYTLSLDVEHWDLLPPIGRAVTGTRLYVVNKDLKPVSEGESGELLIAGECLCRGYHQRPELNAERFVTNVLGEARLYRTGDLVKPNSAGELEYLGRIDNQIKIQGYRIETGEIEALIEQHELIQDCAVVAIGEHADTRKLAAYVVLNGKKLDAMSGQASMSSRQSENWKQVWERTYLEPAATNPEFDISGWLDSYEGNPIPEPDMRSWVNGIVHKLRQLNCRNAIEIGCGAGLIMYGFAPYCDSYHATDYSPAAIARLQRHLDNHADKWPQCSTEILAAQDIQQLTGRDCDLLIMNSLTQHLAGGEALFQLITAAAQMMGGSGKLFVGDVTCKDFRAAFFADLALYQSRPQESVESVYARVEKNLGADQELVISPRWFQRLPQLIPAISDVDITLKRGTGNNELTRFRYDVVLTLGGADKGESACTVAHKIVDFSDGDSAGVAYSDSVRRLESQLSMVSSGGMIIKGLLNERIRAAQQKWQALRAGKCERVAELNASLATTLQKGIDPEEAIALANQHGWEAKAVFGERTENFDLVLRRPDEAWPNHRLHVDDSTAMHALVSHPMGQAVYPDILKDLYASMKRGLPEYMHPFRFELLQAMPLTPSGKLDRRSLPKVSHERPILEQEFIAPSTTMEKQLAKIWTELLQIDRVGINDNFFDLGGNSLLSVKVALRIKSEIGAFFDLVSLYQYPTIKTCAQYLEQQGGEECTSSQLHSKARERARQQKNVFARGKRPLTQKRDK